MRARLPWILFFVSLALNIFFIGGVVFSNYEARRLTKSPEARVEAVAERLGVPPQGLLELRKQVRAQWEGARGGMESLRAEMLDELAKPELDRDKIRALMAQRSELRQPAFEETIVLVHDYLRTLSPDQRDRFVAMARERGFLRGLLGRGRGPRRD